jgi:hypothetical protein
LRWSSARVWRYRGGLRHRFGAHARRVRRVQEGRGKPSRPVWTSGRPDSRIEAGGVPRATAAEGSGGNCQGALLDGRDRIGQCRRPVGEALPIPARDRARRASFSDSDSDRRARRDARCLRGSAGCVSPSGRRGASQATERGGAPPERTSEPAPGVSEAQAAIPRRRSSTTTSATFSTAGAGRARRGEHALGARARTFARRALAGKRASDEGSTTTVKAYTRALRRLKDADAKHSLRWRCGT